MNVKIGSRFRRVRKTIGVVRPVKNLVHKGVVLIEEVIVYDQVLVLLNDHKLERRRKINRRSIFPIFYSTD